MLRTEGSSGPRLALSRKMLRQGSEEVRFLLSKDLSNCRKGMHCLGRWKTQSMKWLLTGLRQGSQDERRGQSDRCKDGEQTGLGN